MIGTQSVKTIIKSAKWELELWMTAIVSWLVMMLGLCNWIVGIQLGNWPLGKILMLALSGTVFILVQVKNKTEAGSIYSYDDWWWALEVNSITIFSFFFWPWADHARQFNLFWWVLMIAYIIFLCRQTIILVKMHRFD